VADSRSNRHRRRRRLCSTDIATPRSIRLTCGSCPKSRTRRNVQVRCRPSLQRILQEWQLRPRAQVYGVASVIEIRIGRFVPRSYLKISIMDVEWSKLRTIIKVSKSFRIGHISAVLLNLVIVHASVQKQESHNPIICLWNNQPDATHLSDCLESCNVAHMSPAAYYIPRPQP